jgi:hypothetical protein
LGHGIRDIMQDDEESIRNQQEHASTAAKPLSLQESCCWQGHGDEELPVQLVYQGFCPDTSQEGNQLQFEQRTIQQCTTLL